MKQCFARDVRVWRPSAPNIFFLIFYLSPCYPGKLVGAEAGPPLVHLFAMLPRQVGGCEGWRLVGVSSGPHSRVLGSLA